MAQVDPNKVNLYEAGLLAFLEGARILAALQHSNVVQLLDCVQANDTAYLVTRYLQGHSLQELIFSAKSLSNPPLMQATTVRSLFVPLLQALEWMHGQGVVHLDIKPANIFVTLDDQPVLLDFGAVRRLGLPHGAHRPPFTPGFSAPELRASDAQITVGADLYGVGASIVACISGWPPARSPAFADAAESLPVDQSLDSPLLTLAAQCLAIEPHNRPPSAAHFLKALHDIKLL